MPAMPATSTAAGRRVRRQNPTVRPSGTWASTAPASRFKPMTIRVVTSEDEASSSSSDESNHSDHDVDMDGFDDDDVFMPAVQATATAVPVKTQRAQAARTVRKTAKPALSAATASTTTASKSRQDDAFPPALVALAAGVNPKEDDVKRQCGSVSTRVGAGVGDD
ncbi:hypothetical protein SPBR_07492 [Sporothrix brasiliensis 5110]|uniref:Uncharacterized protein n=1 Tax=Sporothrix brasiliensis 5110 TaxID=1398154 RepID=A0A0C2IXI6_9PEZI|nr:uncharacterized protein SPBR_07492 [Sporothrix brasiliensis 5110]KIH89722.1 hypothetical protein SPBR_07492 [Sporothrix brasiliensis 5110]